jgi:hypothetical protein
MARIVLTNVNVTIGGVDLSDHIASVSLSSTYDVLETTAFGGGNVPAAAKDRIAGLVDNSVTFEFHQDFAASSVEATIYPLLGTAVACVVTPVVGAVSATNPEYQFNALISEWTPLNGAVGELATASVTWPISGPVTKDVTP